VKENAPRYTEVGRVTASDLDLFPHNNISFYLHRSHARRLFRIDPDTGILYTLQSLDREVRSVYLFIVGVQYVSLAKARVKVTVDDVNDCTPTWVFPKSPDNDTVHVSFGFGMDDVALAALIAEDADDGDNAKLRSVLLKLTDKSALGDRPNAFTRKLYLNCADCRGLYSGA